MAAAKAEKLSRRLIFLGTTRAMVAVSSSISRTDPFTSFIKSANEYNRNIG